MAVARAFLRAERSKEPAPQPQAKKVARSPRSSRDPQFMRKVDRLDLRLADARVSSPHDAAEKEAEANAKLVAAMSEPEAAAPEPQQTPPPIARRAEGETHATPGTMAEIEGASPLGRPLPTTVRRFMEPRFRADFSSVRIHTGEHSARLNRRLNAQAFTVGHQVFFGEDQFRPETREGKELIAHELTHTVQQGAAPSEVDRSMDPHVQRLGFGDILDWLAGKANLIPGFRMFTIVLGVNPVNMSPVERSAANILRAIVEFMPGGGLIVVALDKYGVFDKVGSWVESQLSSLGISGSSIKAAVTRFIDSLGLSDLFHPGDVWDRAKAIFSDPIGRIITFVEGLAAKVIEFVKDAILKPLAELASKSEGWDLLCAVLGKNPITGEAVPRTAETLIGGFMKLIGQEEIWENIKKGNAVARAWAWFQGALEGLLGFVRQIPGMFLDALKSLEIADIVILPQAFAKVGRAFAGFIGRFLSWAGNTIWDLLEIIFSVVAPAVIVYVKKAAGAFKTILKNPIGFVKNLIAAGKQGLSQFVGNFVQHLKSALIGWLTGSLAGAGVYIPQALSLLEIGKFVLSILGITWEKIRGKIVKVIGEPAMKALETGFDVVVALIRGGPAAAWNIIKEKLTDLKDMVIQSIISFVKDRIVSAAVTKLLSMLSPVGAFIQAIIGIYNTVMFFVERMRQIAQVAASVIDSISAIASGVIGAAANKVESTMGGLLTLVISFLARIAGLGKVSDAVVGFIKNVQAKVDQAIDAGIAWVVAKAKSIFKSLFGPQQDPRTDAQKAADLDKALDEAQALLTAPRTTKPEVKARLPAIKAKYKVASLDVVTDSTSATAEVDHIEGSNSPPKKKPAVTKPLADDPLVGSFTIERPSFRSKLKRLFRERYPTAHQPDGTLLDDIDRRHIISSDEMAKHISGKLAPLHISEAVAMLANVKKNKVTIAPPPTREKIIAAAVKRHREFFNCLDNLWPGDASKNRSIGAARDAPGAGEPYVALMSTEAQVAHEKTIYNDFGLD
ncbi:MAG TPA: DUF4157 domain-containing protein [Myxococcales bacterium]|jgi:hypothetical protein